MRPLREIEQEISTVTAQLDQLKREQSNAKLADFLAKEGVPDGVLPIFEHKNSQERVLVIGFKGMFPVGQLIKRDGSLSSKVEKTLYPGEYVFAEK